MTKCVPIIVMVWSHDEGETMIYFSKGLSPPKLSKNFKDGRETSLPSTTSLDAGKVIQFQEVRLQKDFLLFI